MNIRVDLNYPIKDGTEVVFRSPVDCSQVTGLKVYYDGGSQEFAFADAHGNNVGDIDHLFSENVAVNVILDVTTGMAFVQNADTNAYLEGRFAECVTHTVQKLNEEEKAQARENIGAAAVGEGGITVTQTTGDSETAVMSQKAVTENLIPHEIITDPNFIGKNILTGVTEKGRFTDTNGIATDVTNEYQTTDLMPVIPNCRYRIVKGANQYIGFYPIAFTDAKNDGVVIAEGDKGTSEETLEFTIPEGKTYLVINFICTGYDFTPAGLYRITQLDSEKIVQIPNLSIEPQAEEIKSLTVPFEKIENQYFEDKVDLTTVFTEEGHFTDQITGEIVVPTNPHYRTTAEMLPVYGGQTYRISYKNSWEGSGCLVYGYGESKTNGVEVFGSGYVTNSFEFVIPDGVCYLAINTVNEYNLYPVLMERLTQQESDKLIYIPNLYVPKFLDGKKILNLGDSIFGNDRTDNISEFLAKYSGATVYNGGLGGTRMSSRPTDNAYEAFDGLKLVEAITSGDWSFQDACIGNVQTAYYAETLAMLKSLDMSTIDIVTLAWGANDWTSEGCTDEVTTNALASIIDMFQAAYPKIRLLVCTPIYRLIDDGDTDTVERYGRTMPVLVKAIEDKAKAKHISVLNSYENMPLSVNTASTYFDSDNVHLNTEGNKLYAELISGKLISMFGTSGGRSGTLSMAEGVSF